MPDETKSGGGVPKWRPWPGGECPHCGNSLEVLTDETRENWACDGDPLRCVACGCPGQLTEFDDESVTESMHDDPGCDCEWCRAHPVDGCTCGYCGQSTPVPSRESAG